MDENWNAMWTMAQPLRVARKVVKHFIVLEPRRQRANDAVLLTKQTQPAHLFEGEILQKRRLSGTLQDLLRKAGTCRPTLEEYPLSPPPKFSKAKAGFPREV